MAFAATPLSLEPPKVNSVCPSSAYSMRPVSPKAPSVNVATGPATRAATLKMLTRPAGPHATASVSANGDTAAANTALPSVPLIVATTVRLAGLEAFTISSCVPAHTATKGTAKNGARHEHGWSRWIEFPRSIGSTPSEPLTLQK